MLVKVDVMRVEVAYSLQRFGDTISFPASLFRWLVLCGCDGFIGSTMSTVGTSVDSVSKYIESQRVITQSIKLRPSLQVLGHC